MSYKRRNYRKKYNSKNRMLRMKCPVHGVLVGYTSSYDDSPVYEALNRNANKVELKCFKCMEEPFLNERKYNSMVQQKVEEDAYNKFGRKSKFIGNIGVFFLTLTLLAPIVFWFFSLGFFRGVILGVIFYGLANPFFRTYAKYEKQRVNYIEKNTEHLNPVPSAQEVRKKETGDIISWRIEQAEIRKEKERIEFKEKMEWLNRMDLSLEEVDKMPGLDFEVFIKNLLNKSGYKNSIVSKASGDQGADIITYKDGKKIAVQCKRYSTSKVSNSAIQEVFSAKGYFDCHEAYVITNSYFTKQAIELAEKHQVKLIDRQDLFRMMENANHTFKEENMAYQTEFNFDN